MLKETCLVPRKPSSAEKSHSENGAAKVFVRPKRLVYYMSPFSEDIFSDYR